VQIYTYGSISDCLVGNTGPGRPGVGAALKLLDD
jgi:hypothetical protein